MCTKFKSLEEGERQRRRVSAAASLYSLECKYYYVVPGRYRLIICNIIVYNDVIIAINKKSQRTLF